MPEAGGKIILAYNSEVPTPFYHLSIAAELLAHPDLTNEIQGMLQARQSAFYFGNTAPDVQSVSGQRRDDTHFFGIPPQWDPPPWQVLLAKYRKLARPAGLDSSHAAFMAGYLCHLQADISWVAQIFIPVFWEQKEWADFKRRLFYHNVVRTYLDGYFLQNLPGGMSERLMAAVPNAWLPFVEDQYLCKWRDYLADQLQPGAQIETIEVFARRQGISVEEFTDLVNSEDRMEAEIFSHIPRQLLVEYRQKLIQDNVQLLLEYLGPLKERNPR